MSTDLSILLQELLHFETELRLYHWTTASFARHKATDELYQGFREWLDEFLEVAFGGDRARQDRLPAAWKMPIRRWKDADAPERVAGFAKHVHDDWVLKDTGLASLRDDLVNLLHKAVYLFRLD